MKKVRDAFESGKFILDLDARDMESAIRQSVYRMAELGIVKPDAAGAIADALVTREAAAPTAIGHASAIPHTYLDAIDEQLVVFVRIDHPINTGAPDGIPTRFLFFLLGPPDAAAQHLDTLAYVARIVSDDEFRYELDQAKSGDGLLTALDHFTKRTAPEKEPVHGPTAGLQYTGKLFGGLRDDLARRIPHYVQDFRDGLHPKCFASTLFLYFACLAPAVTFGGVMAVATEGHIGAVEMIVASAFCGVVFALISGQPLIILGGTGPLLVFTAIMYSLCQQLKIDFLSTYGWVGLWSAGMLVLLAITDASCLMRYFTRFTDEIFSALISIIFIYEAFKELIHEFQGLDETKHHDTALLTLLLALGTFYIAMSLSRFRRSSYLRPKLREFLADFGPAIALCAMTGVAVWLHEVHLERLNAPDVFRPTLESRESWMIDLFAVPMWVRIGACVPAIFVTVLVYLDQNITGRIVNSPDHRLNKGEAYHLDLLVVGGLMAICSVLGLPWLVAATVRSLNHVRSLATVEEVVSKGGERRDQVIHVRENRLTGLTIHILIGVSLLLLPWLKQIPLAVLYGIFLFMGVVSMTGNQFFERLSLWLKDPALYPVTHYIRRVPHWTIHAFTVLQLACLAVLWVVKSSAIGILFPVFIALLVPVRMLAGKFFLPEHLAALDAEEEPEEEETHWAA